MSDGGYIYRQLPLDDVEGERAMALRVDALDLDIASTVGFHTWLADPGVHTSDLRKGYEVAAAFNDDTASRNHAFVVALEGPSGTSGCRGRATEKIFGGRTPAKQVFSESIDKPVTEKLRAAFEDPGYKASVGRWRDCMAASGYKYDNPGEPAQSFVSAPAVSAQEIKIAVQDSTCRRSAHLSAASEQAERRIVSEFLAQSPGLIEVLRKAVADDVSSARAALGA